ncbi:MAG TPA: hypothetical protein PKD73_03485 [Burkholderiaceae bacterium]|nr:hypothetical protein [Burkholderiaceae bacterium]
MKPRAILTTLCALGALTLSAGGALAKLPPLDEAAKAKAAEAAAKAAWAAKADAFQLCRAQDRLVGYVQRTFGEVEAGHQPDRRAGADARVQRSRPLCLRAAQACRGRQRPRRGGQEAVRAISPDLSRGRGIR